MHKSKVNQICRHKKNRIHLSQIHDTTKGQNRRKYNIYILRFKMFPIKEITGRFRSTQHCRKPSSRSKNQNHSKKNIHIQGDHMDLNNAV